MAVSLHSDTIFALSSGRGRAAIAVVRVSGPGAGDAICALAGPELPQPRATALRKVVTPSDEPIDEGIILWFPGPESFTGEDVAEFQIHGGRATVEALLEALGALSGLRPAEAGEFTRRAVENGKFDLVQAEALADLINAETEAQRRQALRQYGGALSDIYEGWRTALIRAAAWVEAAIDFSDEEIPEEAIGASQVQVAEIADKIRHFLDDGRRGEILRDGFHLTVIGPPNSGKSSLVNALTRREVAIVTPVPGTTRDALSVHLDLGGYPVILTDTAGLRETSDLIEGEGVRRARLKAEEADAILLLLDVSQVGSPELSQAHAEKALTVWNKGDLPHNQRSGLLISVKTGEGIPELLIEVTNLVKSRLDWDGPVSLPRARHRKALQEAESALRASLEASSPELVAEELRVACRHLGRITGRVDVEDLLDVVFRDFCIGK
jgi:tRNA modification GTPase